MKAETLSLSRRPYIVAAGLVLILSLFSLGALDQPGYTDAYYYYNAAARWATGEGLTDPYLWMYINAPDEIPTASHRYWMPLASLVMALPMFILGEGFNVARLAFIPCWIVLAWMGVWLGGRTCGHRRGAWAGGIMTALGGFYLPYWLQSDTFTLFGALGAGALIALGLGREHDSIRLYALAGLLSGLAHLTRADGLLFVMVGLIVIAWPYVFQRGRPFSKLFLTSGALVGAYLIVMLPWFMRNMSVIDAPLPPGGLSTIFLKGYNDLFSYPAVYPLSEFLDWGAANILRSRWDGLLVAFQTWLAVEGLIILAPFGLYALWQRRREKFWAGMIWYALGLHLAMSIFFTFPGMRGGLFHSSAALYPFWVALGLAGVDSGVKWLGKKRRWRVQEAQLVFGTAALFLPLALGLSAISGQFATWNANTSYSRYVENLPDGARLMVNDPASWYYHTGLMGVTLMDEPLEVAREIAERYCITHLIIDENVTSAFEPLLKGETPPPFLREVGYFEGGNPDEWSDDVRIFAFDVPCAP